MLRARKKTVLHGYEGGLEEYLLDSLNGSESIPTDVVIHSAQGEGRPSTMP